MNWLLKTSVMSLTFCVTYVLVIFHLPLQICSQPLSVTLRCLVSQGVLPMFFCLSLLIRFGQKEVLTGNWRAGGIFGVFMFNALSC